jgi:hypothetical protein
VLGAALQQAVCEPAGRGADVEAPTPGDVEAERVERVGELDAAARDVRRRRVDGDLHVLGHQLPRLGRAGAPGTDVHVPGQHRRGSPRPGREQATLSQQAVEADPGHGATR